MEFQYSLHTEIIFGCGKLKQIGQVCSDRAYQNGILVCDPMFVSNGLSQKVIEYAQGRLCGVFSDITPNPTISSVNACARIIEQHHAGFLVALGGGSSMDCAKAASVVAFSGHDAQYYHSGGGTIDHAGVPLIAVPTTAGTGSEVTNVAVLSDTDRGIKAPMASARMFAKIALVDPELTLSVPPQVVASTGLDVISHALEAYWSKNHLPICDAAAIYAAKLAFDNLYRAYEHGDDIQAKENMSLASLIAGLAFGPPKTAASHACSFPLTNLYHIPHGEACAFTLDALVRINCETDAERLETFARMVGFSNASEMADEISSLKHRMRMRCTLQEAGIAEEDVPALAEACEHPNLRNNPVYLTKERLIDMFLSMK